MLVGGGGEAFWQHLTPLVEVLPDGTRTLRQKDVIHGDKTDAQVIISSTPFTGKINYRLTLRMTSSVTDIPTNPKKRIRRSRCVVSCLNCQVREVH